MNYQILTGSAATLGTTKAAGGTITATPAELPQMVQGSMLTNFSVSDTFDANGLFSLQLAQTARVKIVAKDASANTFFTGIIHLTDDSTLNISAYLADVPPAILLNTYITAEQSALAAATSAETAAAASAGVIAAVNETAAAIEASITAATGMSDSINAAVIAAQATIDAGAVVAGSAAAAAASELAAAGSASDANDSAIAALAAAGSMSASVSAALGYATAADNSAIAAAASAQTATTKAEAAANSAYNASVSAGTASTRANEAAASALAAAGSASTASSAATSAVNSLTDITVGLAGKAPLASPVFTGVITVPIGSAAAPAITIAGDTNTGLFSATADTLGIATGGVEIGRFASTGLRLGATTGNAMVNITQAGTNEGIRVDGSSGAGCFIVEGGGTRYTHIRLATVGSGYMATAPPANGMAVEGNVLVGTATDASTGKLQVTGNTALTGTLAVSSTSVFTGSIGIWGTGADSRYAIGLSKVLTDPTSATTTILSQTYPTYTGAESVTEYFLSAQFLVNPIINTGHTNTGYCRSTVANVLRNGYLAGSDDSGTLTELGGLTTSYGHNNINSGATPITTRAYGVFVAAYYRTGTITDMYDIYLTGDSTGGTVTNRWGIYQVNSANNALTGKLRVGGTTAPVATVDVTGNILATTSILSSGGGIGYTTGAGGAATQLASKATTVVLNEHCGTITLHNAELAANTTVGFTLTNSNIAATDIVVIVHDSVGTIGAYGFAVTPAAGSATVSVRNLTSGALSEAIVLRFAIIKGVVA